MGGAARIGCQNATRDHRARHHRCAAHGTPGGSIACACARVRARTRTRRARHTGATACVRTHARFAASHPCKPRSRTGTGTHAPAGITDRPHLRAPACTANAPPQAAGPPRTPTCVADSVQPITRRAPPSSPPAITRGHRAGAHSDASPCRSPRTGGRTGHHRACGTCHRTLGQRCLFAQSTTPLPERQPPPGRIGPGGDSRSDRRRWAGPGSPHCAFQRLQQARPGGARSRTGPLALQTRHPWRRAGSHVVRYSHQLRIGLTPR